MPTDNTARPNVLLVVTDQQRWDTLGVYGSPMDLTPNLDRLAAEGARFDRAMSSQPVCGSSQSVLQTGRYATETGVWRHSLALDGDVRTLADYLGDEGYQTGFVGTWHMAGTFEEPVPPTLRGGYDDFWVAADVPEFTTQPTEGTLYDEYGDPVTFDAYRTDAFTDIAEQAIDALTEPFLLVVNYLEPHHQNDQQTFVAPEGYAERYQTNPHVPPDLRDRPGDWFRELPDYYGIVERLDECVGRLLGAFEERTAAEDAVVAFTSDHGCHFRTRPGEYKRSCHESSIHVPLLIDGPGVEAGTVVEEVVSLVDLAPTILDLVDADRPAEFRGRSLLSPAPDRHPDGGEAFIQISGAEIGRAIRTDRWKLSVAARTADGWRGGLAQGSADCYVERYLYDLARDPHERINLAGRPETRAVFEDLRTRLHEYIETVEGVDAEVVQVSNPGYQDF